MDPPSLPTTPLADYGADDDEGGRAVAEGLAGEGAGAEAAAEEHAAAHVECEEATQAPAPGEGAGEAAAEGHSAGGASSSHTWLGADPNGPPPVQRERMPERQNIFTGQLTPPEDLLRGTPEADQQRVEELLKEGQ